MKKVIFATLMSLVGLLFAACSADSSYDEDFGVYVKPSPTPTPSPDTTKVDNWGTPVKNNLVPIGEPTATYHMWHGIQVFYNSKKDSLVRTAEMPVNYELTPSEGFSWAKTAEKAQYAGMSSNSANNQNTTYGDWYNDTEGNTLREIKNSFEVKTTEFVKTLKVSHFEGYSTVNGRNHSFKHHVISASFVSLDSISGVEYESNDSVYCDVTYLLKVAVKATPEGGREKSYELSANHTVRRFLHMKEVAPAPAPKSNWQFVKATLVFDPNGSYEGSKGAFAKCITLKNSVTQQWALAITSSGNVALYDFKLYKFSFAEYPSTWKIDSAVWNQSWEPAHISGTDPWYYTGVSTKKGMTQQEADICGIKNFTGSHTAENSALLNLWSAQYAADGTLCIFNEKGACVFSIK